nr:reverse transcriptase domain-containing protein [Tanacetum cinerariifolium]
MADNQTMKELLQAPMEGYEEAIVISEINADHFEVKTNLLQLVQANPYHGFEWENPHTHINNFKRITSTLKFKDVPNDVIKLMMFYIHSKEMLEFAPNIQVQQGLPNEFSSYKKSNESMMQNLQIHINGLMGSLSKQEKNLKKNLNDDMRSSLGSFFQNQALTSGTLLSNTIPNPKGQMKAITTRSGVAYEGPSIPTNPSPKDVVEREIEKTTNKEQTNFQGSTAHIQPPLREKATNQMEKFFQIFQDFHFDISFVDALLLIPKFASMIKSLLANKDKLFELAKIPLNENFSAMLLKMLPKKLGDPDKFLILWDFLGMDMTLKLADRSITHFKGVAEDVFVRVGKFYFSTDFVVVDFEADPRVSFILGRSFLSTGLNRINVIDVAREEYAQEVLGFSKKSLGGNPTLTFEPIISYTFPSLTPFEGSDFILEKIEAYLKDDSQEEVAKAKSSIEEPLELELKDLPSNLEYAYLEGVNILLVIIAKDTNLVLKWEKCHFMVKEGIVLGHKISKNRLEVDRAKVDVITKLPHPTTVKGVKSFLGQASFYRRFIQDLSKIARPMTHLLEKETPFVFPKDCIDAFETLKKKLIEAPILVVPYWNLPFELMCDASDFVIEAKALPNNDARVVVKFLKSLFARFGTPRAIISDRGTHVCNDKFAKVMSKYGVTHRLATAYHPQTSGQVEVLNRGLKRILERAVGENRASCFEKLEDALWAFRTAYKTPIGCTPYKLVYRKSCHLPIKLEHKAY